jgi:hypothetical protein
VKKCIIWLRREEVKKRIVWLLFVLAEALDKEAVDRAVVMRAASLNPAFRKWLLEQVTP